MRVIPCLAFCLLLVACGGSSGDSPADTTAPTVTAITPADATTGVSVSASIRAIFSEAMAAGTITDSSFALSSPGGAVSATVAYDSASQTAVLTPAADLQTGTVYTAVLTTDCEDPAGNYLQSDYSWTFTTETAAGLTWEQVGDQVSPTGGSAAESEDPEIFIAANKPVVAYRHASFAAALHVFDSGSSSWGTTLTTPDDGNIESSIYSTPGWCQDGDALYLIYGKVGISGGTDAEFYNRIFVHRWTEAGGFAAYGGGAELSVPWDSVLGGVDAGEPQIIRTDDKPVAVWVEADVAPDPDTEDRIYTAYDIDAGTYTRVSTPLNRDATSGGGYDTAAECAGIGSSPDGTKISVALWENDDADQDRSNLFVSNWNGSVYSNLGGALDADYSMGNNLCVPSVAVTDAGQVFVAYTVEDASLGTRHVYVKSYVAGAWRSVGDGPVSAFSASDHYDSAEPQLLLVGDSLFVTWAESDQYEGPFIFVAVRDITDGIAVAWTPIGNKLNVDRDRTCDDPALAWDATANKLYVAFTELVDGYTQIFVKRATIDLATIVPKVAAQ